VPTKADRISAAAAKHRLLLNFGGDTFSGPAWDRLIAEGKAAQFFLVVEEHGIAENPMLVSQLFPASSDSPGAPLDIPYVVQQACRSSGVPDIRWPDIGETSDSSGSLPGGLLSVV
jgi:hypothetical protein